MNLEKEAEIKRTVAKILHVAIEKNGFDVHSGHLRSLRETLRSCGGYWMTLINVIRRNLQMECERRLYAMHIADYFYTRSRDFRMLFNAVLKDVLTFTCEVDPIHFPLPKPVRTADKLKVYTIKAIKSWHQRFSNFYPQLTGAVNVLKRARTLDFARATSEMEAEREKKREAEEKKQIRIEKHARRAMQQFSLHKEEMYRCLEEARSALLLLVPKFGFHESEDSGISTEVGASSPSPSTSDKKADNSSSERIPLDKSLHGYAPHEIVSITLSSSVPSVTVTDANEDIVQTVRDSHKLLSSFLEKIDKWLKGIPSSPSFLSELISLKNEMNVECARIRELNIGEGRRRRKEGGEDSEDDEFIDVPEKEVEEFVAPDEVPSYIMDYIANQPGPSSLPISEPKKKISAEKLDGTASVSFGLDLLYWGEKRSAVEIPMNNSDCHRFWRPPDDVDLRHDRDDVYETRVMTFVGEPIRGERVCRAPLAKGGTCPRIDITRCPVHGLIIDRDEMGFPQKETTAPSTSTVAPEEDEFMRDLEAQTGRSLRDKPKRKGKKKKEEVSEGRMVRQRLESKLLNPKAIRRVGQVLDEMHKARIQRKFGQQFSHL